MINKYYPAFFFFLLFFCCQKKSFSQDKISLAPSSATFANFLEVNAFEWDFALSDRPDIIDEVRFNNIKSFGGIRHYLDWGRIESKEGSYTFSVMHSGGWDLDEIYTRMKESGLNVLIDC